MAKQIIILEKQEAAAGRLAYRVAYWCTVPANFQLFYANANFESAWKTTGVPGLNNGPDAGELTALRNGSVVEIVKIFDTDASLSLAQIKTALQSDFTTIQGIITVRDPWDRYGSFFDGTSWTNGGV